MAVSSVRASARARTQIPKHVRVYLVAAILAAGATALTLRQVNADGPSSFAIPWWLLTLVFAAAEIFVLHVQVRREAQTISLSEIPLALGLFFCSPLAFVLARVVGPFVVFVVHRRQAPMKVIYNTALLFAEAALALTIFTSIAGQNPEPGPASWVALYAAAALGGGVFVGLCTTFVISLYEGRLLLREFLSATIYGTPLALFVATIGLLGVHVLRSDPSTAWMLVLTGFILFGGYRAYGRLLERHTALERLYRFSQVVATTPDVDGVLRDVLKQARELLRAEHAELLVSETEDAASDIRLRLVGDDQLERLARESEEPAWLRQTVLREGKTALLARGSRNAAVRGYLEERGFREAIVAPLHGDTRVVGALVVSNRLGDVRTFDDDDAQLLETVANQASIALRKSQLIDQLRHDALHDALTGLPNRVLLQRRLHELLDGPAADGDEGVAAIIMDLDGFKEVNDTLGHQQGDLLLREVAGRLRAAAGAGAGVTIARLGGDEFGVLVEGPDELQRALTVARRLLAALHRPLDLDGYEIEMGASVGIALAPAHASDMAGLLRRADLAMYRAKASGGDIEVFDASFDAGDPMRLARVAELRHAIIADELRLFVQPKVCLTDGSVVGVEALVRWQHPTEGLVDPAEFIGVAERSGLVRPLTEWVVRETLATASRWRREGLELETSINLSPRSLTDRGLIDVLLDVVAEHGLPAGSVTFEITESGVLTDPSRAIALLNRITAAGVRLSIDDFGTGYSSLSYLKRLPVAEVKIDRSFVTALADDDGSAAIVRAVVELGRGLGLTVVAEGVEHREALKALLAFGCDTAQGHFFAQPMPCEDFSAWHGSFDAIPHRPAPARLRRIA